LEEFKKVKWNPHAESFEKKRKISVKELKFDG